MYCQRQLFCFVAFPSASGQTRRMGMVRQGSSLTWLSIRIGLQGRKPGERNKLFDLFYRHRTLIRPIRLIRGRNKNHMHSGVWRVVTSPVPASTPVPGGHYQIVTGDNALGIDSIPQKLPGGQYAIGRVGLFGFCLASR